MIISGLSKRSFSYVFIGSGILLAFIILLIYPSHKSMADMDLEIKKVKSQIEAQKMLLPVFKDLLKKTHIPIPEGLPFPEKAKIARDDTDKILFLFQKVAQKNNIRIDSIIPDIDSLIDGLGYMDVNIVMRGDLFDWRNFLLQLNEISYIEHVERIQVRTIPGSEDLEFHLKLWLARE